MKKQPVHFLLLAIYPVLFLYSFNISETALSEILRSLIIVPLAAFLLWLILNLTIKDKIKSGLIVSILLLLTFSYGHLRDLITPWMWMYPQKKLFVTQGLVLLISAYLIVRTKRSLLSLNYIFNICSVLLVAATILTAGIEAFKGGEAKSSISDKENQTVELIRPENRPDIYYIVPDGYVRSDVMKSLYDYDNSWFIDSLKSFGFYIADKSRSNYSQTTTSMPATLNMTYIDNVAARMGKNSANVIPLVHMIKDSRVMHLLKDIGYKTVAFSTGYWDTEIKNADYFLSSDQLLLNDFESLVLDMTPIPKLLSKIYTLQYDSRRTILIDLFDNLDNLPKTDSPKFVYAHIPAPHEPFVFGKDGEEVAPIAPVIMPGKEHISDIEEFHRKYVDFAEWTNKKLLATVASILSDSTRSSMIIIQADHGLDSYLAQGDSSFVGLTERMAILNAYYFPDSNYEMLYDSITPINSFPIIFNQYFGANLELHEERCYFSRFDTPYDLVDVTDMTSGSLPDSNLTPQVCRLKR